MHTELQTLLKRLAGAVALALLPVVLATVLTVRMTLALSASQLSAMLAGAPLGTLYLGEGPPAIAAATTYTPSYKFVAIVRAENRTAQPKDQP